MVQDALIVVEAEQQRPDLSLLFGIAKATHHAVRGAQLLHLDHCPLAEPVRLIEPLGDDPVQRAAAALQPAERDATIRCDRRKKKALCGVGLVERLERLSAIYQTPRVKAPRSDL